MRSTPLADTEDFASGLVAGLFLGMIPSLQKTPTLAVFGKDAARVDSGRLQH